MLYRISDRIKKYIPQYFKNVKKQYISKSQYKSDLKLFVTFLSKISIKKKIRENAKNIAIYIAPWHTTSVPWFSSTIALFYAKLGHNVVVIIDDVISYDETNTNFESKCLTKTLSCYLSKMLTVKKLSSFRKSMIDDNDLPNIKKLAELKTIHHLKSAFFGDLDLTKKYENLLIESLPYIRSVFEEYHFDFCIVPGGICGNTGLVYSEGNRVGVRVASYDASPGAVLIGTDNIAAQLRDIERCLSEFSKNDEGWYRNAYEFAKEELGTRISGKNRGKSQKSVAGNCEKYDIIIPLNIDWDTAALGIHRIFSSTLEWINETVSFILENTFYTVAVRQHPFERFYSSQIFAQNYLNEKFGENSRFTFISCNDEVNSYSLVKNAKIVLPLSSTIGIESAMLGKHVIVCSNCYYAKCSFVYNAESKDEYFQAIIDAMEKKMPLNESKIRSAEIVYYLSQCCNWCVSSFTPYPDEFRKWACIEFDELFNRSDVQNLLKAFLNNLPIAILNSDDLMRKKISKNN